MLFWLVNSTLSFYFGGVCIIIFTPLRVFHTNVSRWSSTGVWLTPSLLKSPGLFSVFWQILIKLSFRWSSLILWFPSSPFPLSILWWLARCRYLSFFSLSFSFTLWSVVRLILFYCWQSLDLVVWPKLCDLFVSKNPREVCVSHSPGQILGCAYTICSYDQISISCTIPSGLLYPPSRV